MWNLYDPSSERSRPALSRNEALRRSPIDTKFIKQVEGRKGLAGRPGQVYDFYSPYWRVRFADNDLGRADGFRIEKVRSVRARARPRARRLAQDLSFYRSPPLSFSPSRSLSLSLSLSLSPPLSLPRAITRARHRVFGRACPCRCPLPRLLSHVRPHLCLSRSPPFAFRPGSTFGYSRVRYRRTWLGDGGFGASGRIDGRRAA